MVYLKNLFNEILIFYLVHYFIFYEILTNIILNTSFGSFSNDTTSFYYIARTLLYVTLSRGLNIP